MDEPVPSHTPPADVRKLIERIDVAWSALLEAVDGIPDDRLHLPDAVGEWSFKDLFGHIAFWDEHAIGALEDVLAGKTEPAVDWQAMNDADYALRRDRTLPEQWSDMHQAHALLLERLEGVAAIPATAIDEAIRGDTYAHYEEHMPDISAWRERTGM